MAKTIYTGKKPEQEIADVFCNTIEELIKSDDKVMYIDADLMGSMKTKRLWKEYPSNVINTGIQEANMIGVAAGYYLLGLKPYVHTFAPFASRRVFDQIFLSVGYAHKSIRIIGSDAGIMATYNGGTHMCFEDIAMMRAIPGACVIDVSDAVMFRWFLRSTKDRQGVTYFRTPRRDLPDIYTEEETFEEGKGKVLREGEDITIVACGIMVATALQAAQALAAKGVSARVIDIITIKPIDKELLVESAKKTRVVLTLENHNVIGGLASAVAELLSEEYPVTVGKVGVTDRYGQVGNEQYLREQYGLTVNDVIEKAEQLIKKIAEVK